MCFARTTGRRKKGQERRERSLHRPPRSTIRIMLGECRARRTFASLSVDVRGEFLFLAAGYTKKVL